MAINAYVGVPGSGKSYEVVKSVLYPAFISGRRIVTNIEGVEHDKFVTFATNEAKKSKIDLDKLGVIVKVTDEDCAKDNFFPHKNAQDETIAKYGDLICLDEVWRIFPNEKQITENQKSFIAEHRHFVAENGITSDLVVINQSVSNIPKFIKDRIENTFRMSKLKSLGLNSRYRIDVYSTSKLTKANLVTQLQQKYENKYFQLYKSYDGDGREVSIDTRNTIFSKFFVIKIILALLFFFLGLGYLYFKYASLTNNETEKLENNTMQNNQDIKQEPVKDFINKQNRSSNKPNDVPPLSDIWRIQGELKIDNVRYVILIDRNDVIRYELRSRFTGKGKFLKAVIDDKLVTYYSGKKKAQVFYESAQEFKISN